MSNLPLGSIERAYADGYAAAQDKIERLRVSNAALLEALEALLHRTELGLTPEQDRHIVEVVTARAAIAAAKAEA